jgi:hypothetical protein
MYIHGYSGFELPVAGLGRFEMQGVSSRERFWVPLGVLFNGCPRTLFPGVKRLGRGADCSTPFGAEVKKEWRYTSTAYALVACKTKS